MSQSNVEVPPATPAAAAPPAAPPVAAPPAAAPAAAPGQPKPAPSAAAPPPATSNGAAPPADEPNWFKPRVEQAKRSGANEVLKNLGVKDADEAKALIDAAKATADAAKTELQKAQEKGKSAETLAARVVDLEKTIKARADIELGQLTETQRAAVAKLAGDDPAKTLEAIDTLKPTWPTAATLVTPTPATVTPAVPAPTPAATASAPTSAPATTTPAPTAPGGAPNTSPPDRKAEYAAMKAKNPHAAALYLNAYANEIYPRS